MSRKMSRKMKLIPLILISMATLVGLSACSSGPEVKQQQFARLQSHRDFEYDFPTVWKGIESALEGYPITERNPNKVGIVEMKNLHKRTIDTDWIFSRSTEKYVEYTINGTPRKTYLQTRTRYRIEAATILGGVSVTVFPQEEIERLHDDGSSAGFTSVESPERNLPGLMLDKINQAILSAAP
jgi:hypothetical protein